MLRSAGSIRPAWMREVKIEEGTLVLSQSSASRSRILRAEVGYSLKSQGPVKSYTDCAIGAILTASGGNCTNFD